MTPISTAKEMQTTDRVEIGQRCRHLYGYRLSLYRLSSLHVRQVRRFRLRWNDMRFLGWKKSTTNRYSTLLPLLFSYFFFPPEHI